MNETLALVLPVFNEDAVIGEVIREWHSVLTAAEIDFTVFVYDDGSTDGTAEALRGLTGDLDRVILRQHPNQGHGPTILRGYRENLDSTWIFQSDSDGEISPVNFGPFWARRHDQDFLIGSRRSRPQRFRRRILTMASARAVRILFGAGIEDVNCPYRLFRTSVFAQAIREIPVGTFAPNVLLSGIAARHVLRTASIPVPLLPGRKRKDWSAIRSARIGIRCMAELAAFSFRNRLGGLAHLPGAALKRRR